MPIKGEVSLERLCEYLDTKSGRSLVVMLHFPCFEADMFADFIEHSTEEIERITSGPLETYFAPRLVPWMKKIKLQGWAGERQAVLVDECLAKHIGRFPTAHKPGVDAQTAHKLLDYILPADFGQAVEVIFFD